MLLYDSALPCSWVQPASVPGVAVERGALVRVLAVAHVLHLLDLQREARRERVALRNRAGGELGALGQGAEVVGDHAVVGRGVRENLLRKPEPGRALDAAGGQFGQHARVVRRVDDDGDVGPVLGRCTQHRRAADVDILDRVLERAVGARGRLRERVQVDHQQVDRADPVLGERGHVRRQVAPSQQAAVDTRVQRLDAAVEHLRESGQLGDLGYREAGLGEQSRGAAGRQQPHTLRVQGAREVEHAGLVGHRDQGGQFGHGIVLGRSDRACAVQVGEGNGARLRRGCVGRRRAITSAVCARRACVAAYCG